MSWLSVKKTLCQPFKTEDLMSILNSLSYSMYFDMSFSVLPFRCINVHILFVSMFCHGLCAPISCIICFVHLFAPHVLYFVNLRDVKEILKSINK